MRVLVDTNILISAFVFRGRPRHLLCRLLQENHEVMITSYIDKEFYRILQNKWPKIADTIYSKYKNLPFMFRESTHERCGSLRDIKDIPILSDALAHNVDVILSGDKDFLEAGLEYPEVLSVSAMWTYLTKNGT